MRLLHYVSWSRALWIVALTFVSIATVSAQRTLSGTLTDEGTDEPLIGANILVVGTSTGTVTDFDGNYELEIPDEDGVQLRITYTGYATETIDLTSDQSTLDIAMRSGQDLEEVVVVGYGSQTQDEVTSAVTSVKEKDFNQGVVNNPTQLVQGKVAGLQIAQPGGNPNATPTIRLRGLSTLGANTEPLVIIDGVVGATLQSVDPSDIASFDVLKDGSAAAIYGTRAASGVILITTKNGQAGKTVVSYNVQGGLTTVAKAVPVASAERYVELRGEAVDYGEQNDLSDLLTRDALTQVHNVSLSGGLGTGNYRASFNYRDEQGVSRASGFDQLNGRLSVNQTALDGRLKFTIVGSSTSRNSEFGFDEAFNYATTFNPTLAIRPDLPDGDYDGFIVRGGFSQIQQNDYFNPIAIIEQNSNTGVRRDALLSGRVVLTPVNGLDLSAQYSINQTNNRNNTYFGRNDQFRGFGSRGLATRFDDEVRNNLFELTGTYVVDLSDKLNVEVLAGYSYQQLESDFTRNESGSVVSDALGTDNFALASNFRFGLGNVTSGGDRSEIQSYFGRVSLDFDNTYFLQASVRQDGSTRFGNDEKTGIFPAVSGGINLGSFVSSPNVNTLKLRVGYGVTGNIPGESLLSKLVYEGQDFYPIEGNPRSFLQAVGPGRSANAGLRFEKKGELNAGLDFAFLDYKLTGTFDYFRRRTTDLLFPVAVAPGGTSPNGDPFLTNSIEANLDDVAFENTGVEFTVAYDVVSNETFSWTPRVVISTVKTIFDSVDTDNPVFTFFPGGAGEQYQFETSPGAPGQNNAPTQVLRAGEEIGQIYTYEFQDISESGDYVFVDQNNDGTIEFTSGASPDKIVVGSGLPDWTLGFQNEFRFGNFDASLFFRGVFGHSLQNLNRNFYENVSPSRGTDNVVITELFDERLRPDELRFNSLYVEKADFLTLDNASVGYTIPLSEGSAISSLRVALSGQRLFYITGYTGVDPEVRYADNVDPFNPNILAPGIDRRNSYFRTRSFNLAVSVSF